MDLKNFLNKFYSRRPSPFRGERLNWRHSVPEGLSVSPIQHHWLNTSVNLLILNAIIIQPAGQIDKIKIVIFGYLGWIPLNLNRMWLLVTDCCRGGCFQLRYCCCGGGGAGSVSRPPVPATIHRVSRSAIPFSFPAHESSTVLEI